MFVVGKKVAVKRLNNQMRAYGRVLSSGVGAVMEAVEGRRLLAGDFPVRVNFQPASADVPGGYVADTGKSFGARAGGHSFGWTSDNTANVRERNSTRSLSGAHDTLAYLQSPDRERRWELAVPNGQYKVRLVAGDADYNVSPSIKIEGVVSVSGTTSSSARWIDKTSTLNVIDGRLTLSSAKANTRNAICFIEVTSTNSSSGASGGQGALGSTSTSTGTSQQGQTNVSPTVLGSTGGKVEAEDFDATGWRDTTAANLGGAYRSSGVDVERSSNGAYNVGHIKAGEYLTYTVSARQSADYNVNLRLAAASGYGGTFHLEVDGKTLGKSSRFPTTGGWQTYTNVNGGRVSLSAGSHKIRVVFDSAAGAGQDLGNFDYLTFTPAVGKSLPPGEPAAPPSVPSDQSGSPTVRANFPTVWKRAASIPSARFEAATFTYRDKLYVIGGWANSHFESSRRVDVYDPAANKWSRRRDTPAPETHAGVAVDAKAGVVYFVGGHRGDYPSTAVDEVWKYTIAADRWEKLPVRLPIRIGANSAHVVDGQLYSVSGNPNDRVTNLSDVYKLDLSNLGGGFKSVAGLPSPRDHHSSIVVGGKIYIVGGEFGHDKFHDQQKLVHVYDPKTNKWTRLADAPIARSHAEGSIFELNGKIIVGGGQVSPQKPTDVVASYDPKTNRWSTLSSLPAKRQGTGLGQVGDYIVLAAGGYETYQPKSDVWVGRLT